MPSPATTAMRKATDPGARVCSVWGLSPVFFSTNERLQFLPDLVRCLFGQVMAALQRTAAHIIGYAAPFVERLEAAFHHAERAPQGEHLAGKLATRLAVGAIVVEVDRGGGAIVLAARVDHPRREAALVFGPRRGRETLDALAAIARLLAQEELRVGADHAFRQRRRPDEE